MHRKSFISFASLVSLAIAINITSIHAQQTIPPDKQKIADVKAGKIKQARASWWGFDPNDSTRQLQAAINSKVPVLIVDKMPSAWIVKPITLVSNQKIIFQKGVEILAKRGEFKDRGACLFKAQDCTNFELIGYGATFRMWRSDYDNPKLYKHGEWRMCLELNGCSNVNIFGLTLTESGGDGIYLGSGKNGPNKNIHIKDVICDKNYRQGISVISADNLIIENCILSNTKGTAPEAGIDFEPNYPNEYIKNCVMKNCIIKNNNGGGIAMYLPTLDANSPNISLKFENCKIIDNPYAVSITAGGRGIGCPDGNIEFQNCIFENSWTSAINISKPANRITCKFENCVIKNYGTKCGARISPIIFKSQRKSQVPVGGVDFINCVIENANLNNNPMQFIDQGAVGLTDIKGTIIIKTHDKTKTIKLTTELLKKWMPIKPRFANIPYIKLNPEFLKPLTTTNKHHLYNFGFAHIRGFGRYIIYANKNDNVSFTIEHFQVGHYSACDIPVIITDTHNKEIFRAKAPFKKQTKITFQAPKTGFYYITIRPSQNAIRIINCTNPINLICPANLIQSAGTFYFFIPPNVKKCAVRVGGGDNAFENIRAELINPNGKIVDSIDNISAAYQFDINLNKQHTGQIWKLKLSKPKNSAWEDHFVNIFGIPPILAPSQQAIFIPTK